MADDAVPTPPPARDTGGFPLHPGYQMVPATRRLFICDQLVEGNKVWAFVLDTPSTRSVTFWTEQDLRGWRDAISEALGLNLTIHDERDLRALRDASPFEKPL